jgi:hypothetical protein
MAPSGFGVALALDLLSDAVFDQPALAGLRDLQALTH